MNEVKIFTGGGLNYDTELHLLPNGDWIDALNSRMAASDERQEGADSNIEGNVRIGNYNYPDGDNKCIGAFADEFRNVIYAFISNSFQSDEIVEINPETGIITPVFRNLVWTNAADVTQFEPWIKIPSIDVIHRTDEEGDLMFWTEGNTRPRKINIKRAKAFGSPDGYPSPIVMAYTLVAKAPPPSPSILGGYASDFNRTVNNLRGRLFQFQIRYVYDDFEKSTWSGWADFDIPPRPFAPDRDSDPAVNNEIFVAVFTGGPQVKKIEVAFRQNIGSVWGDAYLFETMDKVAQDIDDNVVYALPFYNDTIGVLQPPEKVNQVWDFVPTKAGSQALVNGNTLVYGDVTEGLQFTGPLTVTIDVLMNLLVQDFGNDFLFWKLNGKYRLGLVYFDEFKRTDGVHTYTTGQGDNNDFEVTIPAYDDDNATDNYSIYAATLNAAIYHIPPIWARTFKWVRTPCLTYTRFFYYIMHLIKTDDLENMYFEINPFVNSVALNGQNVISYSTFTPGDRCRIVRKMDTKVPPDTFPGFIVNVDLPIQNLVTDPTIVNTDYIGTYLVVKRNSTVDDYGPALFLLEIYNTLKTGNTSEFFYEFDREYPILSPGDVNNMRHGGMIQNQSRPSNTPATFAFDKGDVYVRERDKMEYKSPDSADHWNLINIPIEDPNFSDKYPSAVNGNGRGYIVDDNQKEQRLPSFIRFGGAYIQDSFINETNDFPAGSFVDNCDRSFGTIKRMTVRDRQLRIFQEMKCGWIPISQNVLQTTTGNQIVSQSEQLLNNIQYYEGDFGIGNAPCSLATKNFADYFHDTNRGAILRLSRDGLTPISITTRMNRFAIIEDLKYKNTVYLGEYPVNASDIAGRAQIYGVFDTKNNEYVSAYEEIASYELVVDPPGIIRTVVSPAKTLAWDEVRNRFVSFYSYDPEWMISLKNDLITFKQGIPYIHNDKENRSTFYGINYDWYIELVFNDKFTLKKTFEAIDIISNIALECPSIITSLTEPDNITLQESNLITSDFQQLEGHFHAVFQRDINSPGGIINGDVLKGSYIRIQIRSANTQELVSLRSAAVRYISSQLDNQ